MISIVTISLQHGSYPPLSGRVDLKEVVGRQVLGQSRFTQPWGRRGKTIVSLRAGRHGTLTECVCKMGEPLHILAHRTQWAQFPAMLTINPMGPVPTPLYWDALPLAHPSQTHCLAVTVSLASRDLPATLESEGSHKTLSTSHGPHCQSGTYKEG